MSRSLPVVLLCILVTIAPTEGTARLFEWIVEYKLAPEAYEKLSVTINGQSPGPTVLAYQGDALIIRVTNRLGKEGLAIEWQGVRKTGDAGKSIPPGNTFTFRFVADQIGMHPYQARSKLQKEAGLYGWIQVLPPVAGTGAPFQGVDEVGKLPFG